MIGMLGKSHMTTFTEYDDAIFRERFPVVGASQWPDGLRLTKVRTVLSAILGVALPGTVNCATICASALSLDFRPYSVDDLVGRMICEGVFDGRTEFD